MKVLQSWNDFTLCQAERGDSDFYSVMGWFFGSRQIARELGMPVYDDDNRIWIVVAFSSNPIACSSIEIKGDRAAIKSAWVKPEHRGKGISSRMLAERLKIAESTGMKVITATATEFSKNALIKHGFENIGMRGRYYLMRKEIGNED